MKLEHKIGIAITCTFLCLIGAVLGLKMQEQPAAESSSLAAVEAAAEVPKKIEPDTTPPTPTPTPTSTKASSFDTTGHKPALSEHTNNTLLNGSHPSLEARPFNSSAKNQPPAAAPLQTPAPALISSMSASNDDGKLKKEEKEKSSGSSSGAVKSSPTFISGPMLLDSTGSPSTGSPLNKKVESLPAQQPTSGANQWNLSPAAGSDAGKNKPQPPFSLNDNEAKAKPTTLKPSADTPQAQPANNSPSGAIAQTSGKDSFMPLGPLPPPAGAPAPSSPSLTGAAPSAAKTTQSLGTRGLDLMPRDSKPAGMSPPLAPANTAKSPDTPASSPITSLPTPVMIAPITPAPSPALTTPSPTPPPPGSPTSPAAFAPAPLPTATPPSPPKPPSDNSSFVPDNHPVPLPANGPPAGAPAPLGAMPALIPLPTAPASVPLGSGSGKPSASAGAAVPQKPAGNGAQVTVYDEQEYVCKPGDTFASISQRYLLTDKYAKALQRHNQNHARASVQMANGGTLTPGEKIFIPQAYVLEQRYADAIPNTATPPSSTILPASSVAPSGAPPTMPSPSPPPAPAPLPSTSGRPPSPPF